MEYKLLMQILTWLVSGGGAAVIVYKFLDTPAGIRLSAWLAPFFEWFGVGPRLLRRVLAALFSTGLALGVYIGMGVYLLGVYELPTELAAWLELIVQLGGVSFTGSQVLHGVKVDRERGDPEWLVEARE